jgi:hypothetical protein
MKTWKITISSPFIFNFKKLSSILPFKAQQQTCSRHPNPLLNKKSSVLHWISQNNFLFHLENFQQIEKWANWKIYERNKNLIFSCNTDVKSKKKKPFSRVTLFWKHHFHLSFQLTSNNFAHASTVTRCKFFSFN